MTNTTTKAEPGHLTRSVGSNMLNMFVTPGDVFEQVIALPFRQSTWIVPTLFVCLAGVFLVGVGTTVDQTSGAVRGLIEAGRLTTQQAATLTAQWKPVSFLVVCAAVLSGTFWSAALVWAMGRFLLKAGFT